jgi:hypothetical protein
LSRYVILLHTFSQRRRKISLVGGWSWTNCRGSWPRLPLFILHFRQRRMRYLLILINSSRTDLSFGGSYPPPPPPPPPFTYTFRGGGYTRFLRLCIKPSFQSQVRVLKELKSVPNLIYAVEQYERYLIQLTKKSKVRVQSNIFYLQLLYHKSCYYIASVKLQFSCLPIEQNRITCRSTKHHVHRMLC